MKDNKKKRVCKKCGIEKSIDLFEEIRSKNGKIWHRHTCLECRSKEAKTNHQKKRPQRLRRIKEYRAKNKDKVVAGQKLYYENNKELVRSKNKQYYHDNNEEIRKRRKVLRKKNKDKIRIQKRKYYDNNRDKIRAWHRSYGKSRRKNDPAFRLRQSVSSSIYQALKRAGSSKQRKSSFKYLPYSLYELMIHIESLWIGNNSWMNWTNWGKYNPQTHTISPTWQLDHIIPQSDLPYTREDMINKRGNFIKCWALENLRPLDSKQNHMDGSTRIRHRKKRRSPDPKKPAVKRPNESKLGLPKHK